MTGAEAKSAFDRASALVKLNRYAEALAVENLLESDRRVIEKKIKESVSNCANSNVVQRTT